MEVQNNGAEGEDTSNTDASPVVDAFDPRSEIENLKQINAELLNEFRSWKQAASAPKEPEVTAEQYQKLFQENPAKAIELAVDKTVKNHLGSFKQDLDVQSKKSYYDNQVEQDFPAMKTDRQFQQAVSTKIKELVSTGEYHKDSPTLVLRAAQLASLNYGKKQTTSSKSISSEAPTNIKPDKGGKVDTQKFETWSKIFNLSDDSKKSLMEKMAQKGAKR